MRNINQIIVHCSYTPPSMDIGVKEIRAWHTDPRPRGNGWSDIGYHWVIRRTGKVEKGRPEERAGAHVAGHNAHSIGICLVGGKGKNGLPFANYTLAQLNALHRLAKQIQKRHPQTAENPIIGHRDIPGSGKACPVMDIQELFREQKA